MFGAGSETSLFCPRSRLSGILQTCISSFSFFGGGKGLGGVGGGKRGVGG